MKKEQMPVLVAGIGEKKSNSNTQWYQQNRIYDSKSIAMCIPASQFGKDGVYWYLVYERKK